MIAWLQSLDWRWSLDGWIVLAGLFCSWSAALLGCFLVLRRMSLLGDAISHAVLPGIAAAFLISGSRGSWFMFLGAVVVGLITVWLTEAARSIGKVDEGAATGVVFTTLFAIGLVMIERTARLVDLDPGCVLYGDLELVPLDLQNVWGWQVPRVVLTLAVTFVLNVACVFLFYKEMQITTFDAELAKSQGFSASFFRYLLASLVAVTCVASFEAVGNILVVAMLIVPPATALLLTKRLHTMIAVSLLAATFNAVFGHLAALTVPSWVGLRSTSTAAMMSVVAGLLFCLAVLFSPRHGLLLRWVRRLLLSSAIFQDDVVAILFRTSEVAQAAMPLPELAARLRTSAPIASILFRWMQFRGWIKIASGQVQLTDAGQKRGHDLVRSHRLWEQYLATETDWLSGRLHVKAEDLEHFTSRRLREKLDQITSNPSTDPHGRAIPPERN